MTADCVVVGLDDSAPGRAGLRWAAAYARRTGVGLRAVHVLHHDRLPQIQAGRTAQMAPDPDTDELYARIRAGFASVAPLPDWTLVFTAGDPGPVLVDQACDSGLLVIGEDRRHGLQQVTEPDVAVHCLQHASVPLVVCPVHLGDVRPPEAGHRQADTVEAVGRS